MTPTPRYTLHLQDSEVLHAQGDASTGELLITLAAAHVCREPGPQRGYLGGVRLRFSGAQWQGELADCVGRIADGHFSRAAHPRQLSTALPAEWCEGVSLELSLGRGAQLLVSAQSLRINAGDGRYTESMAC
jgi:hypothetical protein